MNQLKQLQLSRHHLAGFPLLLSPIKLPSQPEASSGSVDHAWLKRRPETVGPDRYADASVMDQLAGPISSFERALTIEAGPEGLSLGCRDLSIQAQLDRHLLVIGSSGSGKTNFALMPLILAAIKQGESLVLLEAKGDISGPVLEAVDRLKSAGELKDDPKVSIVSFSEPDISLSFNPIKGVKTRSRARSVMTQLSLAETPGKEPFFRMQAVNLGTALIGNGSVKTLPELADIVGSDLRRLESALDGEMPSLLEGLKTGGANAQTVLMEAETYLLSFSDEDVAAVTSASEFNFDLLLREQTIVILRMPEGDTRLKNIHSLFVSGLFAWIADQTKRGGKLKRRLKVFLDEFASALPKLSDFPRVLNTSRSRGVSFVAACQSLSQINSLYGSDAETVLAGFGSFLALPRVSQRDAEYLSHMTGVITEVQYVTQGDIIVGQSSQVRPALLAKEISDGQIHPTLGRCATLLLADTAPIQLWLRPIWEYRGFEDWKSPTGAYLGKPLPKRKSPLTVPARTHTGRQGSGFTNSKGMSAEDLRRRISEVRAKLDWDNTTGSARKWWESFENENQHRMDLVLRLAEELVQRKATVTEFFLAYVYSNCDNIQANLHYLDYTRVKKEEQKNKRIQSSSQESAIRFESVVPVTQVASDDDEEEEAEEDSVEFDDMDDLDAEDDLGDDEEADDSPEQEDDVDTD